MPEDIKSLIDKIQVEGIQAAEEKARAIEAEARAKADELMRHARVESERIIAEAKEAARGLREKEDHALKQAARDMLLVLKQEMIALLGRIVRSGARETLTAKFVAEAITSLINAAHAGAAKTEVFLNAEDALHLEKEILQRLSAELKKGLSIKPSEDVGAGFVISFDAGKSQFDFSEKALAQYIAGYLKPRLAGLLEAAGE